MPYIKKSPIQEKLWELAEKVPGAKYVLPDPYDPASYLMSVGGLTSQAYTKELIKPLFKTKLSQKALQQLSDALRVAAKIPKKVTKGLKDFTLDQPERFDPTKTTMSGVFQPHPKIIEMFPSEKELSTAYYTPASTLAHEAGHGAAERILERLSKRVFKKPYSQTQFYWDIKEGSYEGMAEYLGEQLSKKAGVPFKPQFPYGFEQQWGYEELSKMTGKNPYRNVQKFLERLMKQSAYGTEYFTVKYPSVLGGK